MSLSKYLTLLGIGLIYLSAVAYNIFKIIDPVKLRKLEIRYWWRYPAGSVLPERLDPDVLEASPRRRIQERVGAAIFIVILLFIALSFLIFRKTL